MRKGYFGEAGAQVHYHESGSVFDETIFLLPPAPHTGSYFKSLIPYLENEFHIIAMDYPGYGGSDRACEQTIQCYAKVLGQMIANTPEASLLGFHTGNLVALEIALRCHEYIENIIMIDVPFFDAQTRDKYMKRLPAEGLPTSVQDSFDKTVTRRHNSTSEDRAFGLWVETLRSGRYQGDAFRAAFSYDCEAQFPKLEHPVTVIATQSGLLEPSRKAAEVLPNANLIEMLDITAPVFEAHSEAIAKAILDI